MLPIYPDFYSRRVKAARVVTKEAIPDLGDDQRMDVRDGSGFVNLERVGSGLENTRGTLNHVLYL
jgi:hypothetical protein